MLFNLFDEIVECKRNYPESLWKLRNSQGRFTF